MSKNWHVFSVNGPRSEHLSGLEADAEAVRRSREEAVDVSVEFRGRLMRIYHVNGLVEDLRYQARSVCAWCGLVLKDGLPPTSHGICDRCSERVFSRAPVSRNAGRAELRNEESV
ncbi:hypothetical protein LCGC14_1477830 [marine sediment metagenome]|uniref:Uncharacterized protein n=1 Tax=marine sediment metagenome TaxID=412755 RepID=A0A0F9LQV7_9ZZZZ